MKDYSRGRFAAYANLPGIGSSFSIDVDTRMNQVLKNDQVVRSSHMQLSAPDFFVYTSIPFRSLSKIIKSSKDWNILRT